MNSKIITLVMLLAHYDFIFTEGQVVRASKSLFINKPVSVEGQSRSGASMSSPQATLDVIAEPHTIVKNSNKMDVFERNSVLSDPLSDITTMNSVQFIEPAQLTPKNLDLQNKNFEAKSNEQTKVTDKQAQEDSLMLSLGLEDLQNAKTTSSLGNKKNNTASSDATRAPKIADRSSTASADKSTDMLAGKKKGTDITNNVGFKQAEIKRMSSLIKTVINSGAVKSNVLLEQIMLRIDNSKDINAEYALAKGFGSTGSRNTMQSMFGQLSKLQSRTVDGKIKISLFKAVDLFTFKKKFAEDLIQKQLNNNLGISSVSFQNMYSLPKEQQDALVTRFADPNGKYKDLFDIDAKITNVEKLQLIAEMNDEVMNVICDSVRKDSSGKFMSDENGNLSLINAKNGDNPGAAIFTSEYDASGNYSSRITIPSSQGDCSITTVLDAQGKQTSRSLEIDGEEYTTISRGGWFYGSYKTSYKGSVEQAEQADASESSFAPIELRPDNQPLSSTSKAIFDAVVDLTSAVTYLRVNAQLALQDMQANLTAANAKKAAISTAKIGLLAGKQYLIYQFGAITHIPLASSALLLPIVKLITLLPAMYETNPKTGEIVYETQIKNGQEVRVPKVKSFTGYQLTGYSVDDPTMLLVAMKAIDWTVGDKGQSIFMRFLGDKALISGQGDRVFRQGTAPSNALQWLQGKDMQEENLNETYIDAIPAVLQTAFIPFKMLFPKTLGSTILSKADLRTAANAKKAWSESPSFESQPPLVSSANLSDSIPDGTIEI